MAGVHLTQCDGGIDRTCGLAFVTTIAKTTLGSQRHDIFGIAFSICRSIPDFKLPHARSVNNRAAVCSLKELPMSSCVPTPIVVSSNGLRELCFAPQ